MSDIVIAGAGPSGLALAACAADRGLMVTVVDPRVGEAWTNTYGVWADELMPAGLADHVAHVWSDTEVSLGERRTLGLGRGYALLDGESARRSLEARVRAAGGSVRRGRVRAIDTGASASVVSLDGGEDLLARVVVDATGVGVFTRRAPRTTALVQAAWGVELKTADHPYPRDRMRLMDFSLDGVAAPTDAPTFLYAMPLGDRLFVEETSLLADPQMPRDQLEARLARRLGRDGIDVGPVVRTEHVRIPMDLPIPDLDQPVLAFGAAAAMVHPATGYQVGRAFRTAPAVADALARGLSAAPRRAIRDAYDVIWPTTAVRAHALYTFGARFLASLDARDTLRFFDAFFSLRRDRWAAYLAGDLPADEVARVMLSTFGAVGGSLRLRMMRVGAAPSTLSLLRPFTRLHGSSR